MTFWLFKPTNLLSSKNVLPYKINNIEEFLNFFTIIFFITLLYLKDKIQPKIFKNISIAGLITLIILGIISHITSAEKLENINGIEVPYFENSLSLDN